MNTAALARPDYRKRLDIGDAINSDIRQVIEKNFEAAVKQTKDFAKQLKGNNANDTAHNIWKFLKDHITYEKDGHDSQLVRLPSRFVYDGYGDCKSYSLFTASILANLGMPVAFRYASYSNSKIPSHVYTVTKDESGKEIIIDGVWNYFNSEKKPAYKFDKVMKVYTLSGIGFTPSQAAQFDREYRIIIAQLQKDAPNFKSVEEAQSYVVNMRARIDALIKKYDMYSDGFSKAIFKAVDDAVSVIKIVGLALPRNAYKGLVVLNVHGLGTSLWKAIQKDPNAVKAKWEKLGGDYPTLRDTAYTGSQKKSILGINGVNSQDIGAVPFAAALLTAAPIIAALAPLLKALGVDVDIPGEQTKLDEVLSKAAAAAKAAYPTAPNNNKFNAEQAIDEGWAAKQPETSFSFNKILPIAAVAVGAYLIFK